MAVLLVPAEFFTTTPTEPVAVSSGTCTRPIRRSGRNQLPRHHYLTLTSRSTGGSSSGKGHFSH